MPSNRKRVLCVERSSDICLLICELLRTRGYECDYAATVADASAMARGRAYSLYILNDAYTDGTSAELAGRLRALTPTAPIIVFSAQVYERERRAAVEAGASAFLPKPDGILDLPLLVSRLLGPAAASA